MERERKTSAAVMAQKGEEAQAYAALCAQAGGYLSKCRIPWMWQGGTGSWQLH